MAAQEGDTWQVDLAYLVYDLTNVEVTRVTTHRVTRGMLMSSDDVSVLTGQYDGHTW